MKVATFGRAAIPWRAGIDPRRGVMYPRNELRGPGTPGGHHVTRALPCFADMWRGAVTTIDLRTGARGVSAAHRAWRRWNVIRTERFTGSNT